MSDESSNNILRRLKLSADKSKKALENPGSAKPINNEENKALGSN